MMNEESRDEKPQPEAPRPEPPQPEPPRPEPSSETTGQQTARAGAEAASNAAREAVPLEAVGTREVLVWLLGVLGAKAWQGMGLVPNPARGKIERDLEDARIAIDAFSAILDVVRPRLDEPARREAETMLTTLRLNFVEKSTGS